MLATFRFKILVTLFNWAVRPSQIVKVWRGNNWKAIAGTKLKYLACPFSETQEAILREKRTMKLIKFSFATKR